MLSIRPKISSLALIAFVQGGRNEFTFANALTASVRFVVSAASFILALLGL